MERGKTECAMTFFCCNMVLICTIMLLLVCLTGVGSCAVPGLTSTSRRADFSLLADVVFGQWISASPLEKGILKFSCLFVGFGCGYFPLQRIRKFLDQWDYFGSNFH